MIWNYQNNVKVGFVIFVESTGPVDCQFSIRLERGSYGTEAW